MAQLHPQSGNLSWWQNQSQPRHLPRTALFRPCGWTGCSAQATTRHKGKVYCASHLFKILQQQWQE
jgi:hypothetical protein